MDANGAPVTGLKDISFKSALAGATATAAVETPAASGIYISKLTSTAAGSASVTVQQAGVDIGGVAAQVIVFAHKVGAINGPKSTLAVTPTSFKGDGAAKGAISFVAKDATGAAITGLTDITFDLSGAAAATSSTTPVTESPAGTYTADLSGTAAGAVVVKVKKAGTLVTGVAQVDVTLTA
jgi:hypothetical protein